MKFLIALLITLTLTLSVSAQESYVDSDVSNTSVSTTSLYASSASFINLRASGTASVSGSLRVAGVSATSLEASDRISATNVYAGQASCAGAASIQVGQTNLGLCRNSGSNMGIMTGGPVPFVFSTSGMGIGTNPVAAASLTVIGPVSSSSGLLGSLTAGSLTVTGRSVQNSVSITTLDVTGNASVGASDGAKQVAINVGSVSPSVALTISSSAKLMTNGNGTGLFISNQSGVVNIATIGPSNGHGQLTVGNSNGTTQFSANGNGTVYSLRPTTIGANIASGRSLDVFGMGISATGVYVTGTLGVISATFLNADTISVTTLSANGDTSATAAIFGKGAIFQSCVYDGTGASLISGYNCGTITKIAVGYYGVSFTTPAISNTYVLQCTSMRQSASTYCTMDDAISATTTGYVVRVLDAGALFTDTRRLNLFVAQ